MTKTAFDGPIQVGSGPDDGTGVNNFGNVPAVKRISVSADGTYHVQYLPSCDVLRMWANVESAWTGATTAQSVIRFGTTADATYYGSINVSAAGRYDAVSVSAANLLDISDGTRIVVDVTTVGTAGIGQASVYIEYLQA